MLRSTETVVREEICSKTSSAMRLAACRQALTTPGSRASLEGLIEMSLTIGKGITSRNVSRSVRIITRRSTPIPPPAVGE